MTFEKRNLAETDLARKLQAAGVNVQLSTNWMRVSPSVYNICKTSSRSSTFFRSAQNNEGSAYNNCRGGRPA